MKKIAAFGAFVLLAVIVTGGVEYNLFFGNSGSMGGGTYTGTTMAWEPSVSDNTRSLEVSVESITSTTAILAWQSSVPIEQVECQLVSREDPSRNITKRMFAVGRSGRFVMEGLLPNHTYSFRVVAVK